jgi:inner membrane protein
MTARTHDIAAFASLLTVAVYFPPSSLNVPTIITSSIGSVIGSLMPDLDQESNRLWDLLPAGDFFGSLLKNIFLAHRTISHSLLGTFVVYKILGWLLFKFLNPDFIDIQIVRTSIMVGFVSHLLMDALTEEGLPLFFPLKLKVGFPPVRRWRIKTGKWFEKFVVFPAIIVYIVWFSISNKEKLLGVLKLAIK